MTDEQEHELAEIVLRTRRWAFRDALPEIMAEVRRIVAESDERHRGANKMIADYRRLMADAHESGSPLPLENSNWDAKGLASLPK